MPRKLWKVDFHCPNCETPRSLRSKGLYNHVRLVLDAKEFYYLAGEYLECGGCNKTYISWDEHLLRQLADGMRSHFPAILTRKYACDQSVVTLLRSRTLGREINVLATF